MKKIVGIVLFSFISTFSFAQGEFKFEEESYDFGNIKEGDVAVHSFKFTNTGSTPIIITRVKASCGCTTPYWPKEPIAPGATGEIKASYNSKGRPGNFHKSITITSNANKPTLALRINGITEKAPSKIYTEEEINNSSHLSLIDKDYNFGQIQLGQQVSHKFRVKNSGKSDLTIRNIRSACNCTTYSIDKTSLKAGENAVITIVYKPRTLGTQNELISIYTNDITSKDGSKIAVRGNIVKNASNKSIINNNDKFTF